MMLKMEVRHVYCSFVTFPLAVGHLFEAHKKDTLSPEHNEAIEDMRGMIQGYMDDRKTEPESKAKALLLCKQLGLNASKLDDGEWRVLMKVLERSPLLKRGEHRK